MTITNDPDRRDFILPQSTVIIADSGMVSREVITTGVITMKRHNHLSEKWHEMYPTCTEETIADKAGA